MIERKALYVVTHDYTELTKIGVSKDINSRIKAIRTSVGADLKVYYESPMIDNWKEIETEVIQKFKTEETAGEWVKARPKEIIAYIKTIEYKYNNPEFYFAEEQLEKEVEKVRLEVNIFSITGINEKERELHKVNEGIYRDNDYTFYVTYQSCLGIRTIAFNVYKSAFNFLKTLSFRVVELDLKNKKFINNPKFRGNNE